MQHLTVFAPIILALATTSSAQYGGGQCSGGAAPVQIYVCANPTNCCQQVQCPQQSTCQPRPAVMQACCCPAAAPAPPPPPPQPVIIPVVTVVVPPGAPCPLPYQQCGGGSTCQYTLNLAVCTCPGGQSACNGQCQSGGCGGGVMSASQGGGCVIGAGDWCGPSTNPRCNCVANAQCGPHTGAGIYLCLCNQGFWRRGKACLPY